MVRRAYTQRSLVEVLLPDGDKLWDPTLRRIDTLLDDEERVDRMAGALARRHPQSQCRGRLGTPAAVVLRLLVLKHLYDWSFDECERAVRGSWGVGSACPLEPSRGCLWTPRARSHERSREHGGAGPAEPVNKNETPGSRV